MKEHKHHKAHEMKHESRHEYKPKDGMIDNRMVKENHQQGIKRVMQRREDRNDVEGHHGSMANGWKHNGALKTHWKRNDELTPRKA